MFAVIMNWHTPFAIVILEQHRTIHAGPGAPLMCRGCTVHKSDRLPRSVKPSSCVVAIGKVNLPTRRGLCIATRSLRLDERAEHLGPPILEVDVLLESEF